MTSDESSLIDQLESAVVCGQAGLFVRTHEPEEVCSAIARLAASYADTDDEDSGPWDLRYWDRMQGLRSEKDEEANGKKPVEDDGLEPPTPKHALAAVKVLRQLAIGRQTRDIESQGNPALLPREDGQPVVIVMRNGHREVLNNTDVNRDLVTSIQLTLEVAKGYNCHLILLGPPGAELPPELIEAFWVFDHELPEYDERKEIISDTLERSGFDKLSPERLDMIVKVTGGLTRNQVEGICARSLSRHGEVREGFVWNLKAQTINKRGLLTVYRGDEKFDSYTKKQGKQELFIPGLGGLEGIKAFTSKAMSNKKAKAKLRGLLLLGVPGTGKSAFAKALGNELGWPTLTLDVGALMGSLVGQTEERTREALKIADAMSPCVLFIDEVEKALGGGAVEGDSGVNSRLKGSLLSWQNDHKSQVLLICTANDISKLPPEFTRAGRFNAVFFMDLPKRSQKDTIWGIYRKLYDIDEEQDLPDDAIWTGAEIKSCCETANMLGTSLVDASKLVIPVMKTWRGKITALRKWAHERCVDAETGEGYLYKKLLRQQQQKVAGKGPPPVPKLMTQVPHGNRSGRKIKRSVKKSKE